MGLLSNLFNKKDKSNKTNLNTKEYLSFLDAEKFVLDLLKRDEYIPKSMYLNKIKSYEDTIKYYKVLKDSKMLESYCASNNVSYDNMIKTLNVLENIEDFVNKHNEKFINDKKKSEKAYLDNILKSVDPNILLDDDQRNVVLSDEDYTLVVAGAGAGKTTTVAAKVKYLVEKKGINPKEILVISFTNKAVNELREKINKALKIDCTISTFHAIGYAILNKQSVEKLTIVQETKLYYVLQDYFKQSVLNNKELVKNLILFFSSYFDAPFEGDNLETFFNKVSKSNYSTMKSDLEDFKQEIIDSRSKKKVTIQNEVLRSYQEVEIANFLYMNNIDYEYEPLYKYNIMLARKPYTPDFVIKQGDKIAYIEHFGITESGKNSLYNEKQLAKYKKAVNDKIILHKQHGTTLIYTFSKYNDKRFFIDHLKEQLIANGFVLKPRSDEEVMEKIVSSEENRYIRKLIMLICRFINNFKTCGYDSPDFDRMSDSTDNVRSKLFLQICKECYLEYQRYLKENNSIDFQDMINDSARILMKIKNDGEKLRYKYVIVDEYQDISRQRFDLTKAISEVCDAKIIAVGDDWQSIYAFSGSDITLFTKFKETMGYANEIKIVKTYRNSQEVIDIAGNFIQRNKSQISKQLISNKNITDPVIIYTYKKSKKESDSKRTGSNYAMGVAVETALDKIIEFNNKEGRKANQSILILGRYGFDGNQLQNTGLFELVERSNKVKSTKYPKLDITFMTAHSSKGLGYDNVIIINCRNEIYGFPSKIEDDPVLSFVIKGDQSIEYAEERRLFYVAMTRTKNRVFCIAPEDNPSEFLLELKHDYKNVRLNGDWNENSLVMTYRRKCPMCGYPMQFKYKSAYGLRLHLCTNEPEVCSFMTNDINGGILSIMKCDQCISGYLVVKKSDDNYFLGCTNYKNDGTGCNNTVNFDKYCDLNGLDKNKFNHKKGIYKKPNEAKKKQQEIKQSTNVNFNNPHVEEADIKEVIWRGKNLNNVCYWVLKCLIDISDKRYFGISILVDVLKGFDNNTILKNNFDTLSTYGIYKDIGYIRIKAIVEFLIKDGFIIRTEESNKAVLHISLKGLNYKENINTKTLKELQKELNLNEKELKEKYGEKYKSKKSNDNIIN